MDFDKSDLDKKYDAHKAAKDYSGFLDLALAYGMAARAMVVGDARQATALKAIDCINTGLGKGVWWPKDDCVSSGTLVEIVDGLTRMRDGIVVSFNDSNTKYKVRVWLAPPVLTDPSHPDWTENRLIALARSAADWNMVDFMKDSSGKLIPRVDARTGEYGDADLARLYDIIRRNGVDISDTLVCRNPSAPSSGPKPVAFVITGRKN